MSLVKAKESSGVKIIRVKNNVKEGPDGVKSRDVKHQLKGKLTLLGGVSVIVGSVLGPGIFITPNFVLLQVHSVAICLAIWASCGLLCTLGALCYAELATTISAPGGDYAYTHEAFGQLPAFLTLWANLFIVRPTTVAVVAGLCSKYALKPFIQTGYPPAGHPPTDAAILLAVVVLCVLTAINCMSVSWAMQVQNLFTVAKLVALFGIIVAGIGYLGIEGHDNLKLNHYWGGSYDYASIPLASYSALFAFVGWHSLNVVLTDLQDPHRNLPRAIWIAMPIITMLFLISNLAYFTVLTKREMLASSGPIVALGGKLFPVLIWMFPLLVVMAAFGGINGILLNSARLYVTGAKRGHLPPIFSYFHISRHTPVCSHIFTCVVSVLMVVITRCNGLALINYMSVASWICHGVTTIGLLSLRFTKPDIKRPIKQNILVPLLFLSCCIVLVVGPTVKRPLNTVITVLFIMSGIPVYCLCVKWKTKPFLLLQTHGKLTLFLQKLLLVVVPDSLSETS